MVDSGQDNMIPLLGFVEGDTLGLLVLAHPSDTIGEVAKRLQLASRLRVARRVAFDVEHAGKMLPLESTVGASGLATLARIDVRNRREEHG